MQFWDEKWITLTVRVAGIIIEKCDSEPSRWVVDVEGMEGVKLNVKEINMTRQPWKRSTEQQSEISLTIDPSRWVVVDGYTVNVRASPSLDAAIVGSREEGTVTRAVGTLTDTRGNKWIKLGPSHYMLYYNAFQRVQCLKRMCDLFFQ